MDNNSNEMGDSSVEPQVHGISNNPDVSKVVAAAKLIKNLSQSSMKNVPTEDEENGNKKLEKQGSTDSAKEFAKAIKVANFVRTLSKQSIENKDENENDATRGENPEEGTESASNDVLAKASKAAKLIKQLSKTAMMASSNAQSIEEETADDGKPTSPDVSKVVKAAQVIKRLSEQSLEKVKAANKSADSNANTDGNDDDQENELDKNTDSNANTDGNDDQEKELDDNHTKGGGGNEVEEGLDTASHDAVLGDDSPENIEDEEPEEGLEEKDPTKVAQAAALVRSLSKKTMTRTGSGDSHAESVDGEKTEGKRFKGKWRKSIRDRSRETSLEVQEKIVETSEKEGDIAEHPEEEAEDTKAEDSETATKTEVIKAQSDEVITKQPSAAVEADGDAIKTIESTEITNPKPKTGFCPCL